MNRTMVARELVSVAKDLKAIDFPTQDAFDKYMKEHPDADKSNHRVKDKRDETPEEVEERLKEKMGPDYKPQEQRIREEKMKWDKINQEWRKNRGVAGGCMNRTMVARELLAIAKDLIAFRPHYDLVREIRSTITSALRRALELSGDSMRANPVFSSLLMYESFRDEGSDDPGTDSNKFHYFAIYKDFDTGEFAGGNVWGRIGHIGGAMEIARGENEQAVRAAVMRKISQKRAKGYRETSFE